MAYKQLSPQPVVEGGTGAQTLTDHAVLIGSGTGAITPVGPVAATGALLASNGVGSDPGFTTATYPLTTTVSEILYSSSTNTVTGLATANSAVLTTGATGIPALTALATDGQLIIGSTAGAPAAASLTSTGATITITPGSNSINLESVATGDVSGPGSSTDRAIATWDGTGGTDLFDNATVQISSAGEMTNTTQPAFLGRGSTGTNVTGDGTEFFGGDTDTGTAFTEDFDQGSNFTPGASGGAFFTAPVTGRYAFMVNFSTADVGAAHTLGFVDIITTSLLLRGMNCSYAAVRNSANGLNFMQSFIFAMTAADTCKVSVTVSNGTKVVDVGGLEFGGYLIC